MLPFSISTLFSVFAYEALVVCSHSGTENLAAAEMSLPLLRFVTEVMSVFAVENLDFARSGHVYSFG